jgi:membrane protein YqaA with SNARE-associated domain
MTLLLITFGYAVLSALIPIFNAELYVAGLGTQESVGRAISLSIAAGVGQTVGKLVWHVGAQRFAESKWMRGKLNSERRRAEHDKWFSRLESRPVWSGIILTSSAFVGLPPLWVMATLAGALRVSYWVFVPTVLVGRTARFYLLFWASSPQLNCFGLPGAGERSSRTR